MTPQITLGIAPVDIETLLSAEFEEQSKKLIALYSSAPELLDALELAHSWMHAGFKELRELGNPGCVQAFETVEAIISKAKGE